MTNLERTLFKKLVNFLKSPVTEMIVAACIDLSRNFLFTVVHQYTGDQMIYSIIQYTILILPWMMLGHGALRFPQKTYSTYNDLDNYGLTTSILPKKKGNFLSLMLITSIVIKIISI